MDLETAVAASMLPASRASVAAAFKDLWRDAPTGRAFLELLWAASGRRDPLAAATLDETAGAAALALKHASALGIEPIVLSDERYPPLLACTANPPPVLWARGQLPVLLAPAVAIVGSRAASPYACEVATRLGRELAAEGFVVASGLARGVDSAAHRGCLAGGGRTVAVLGCGVDRVYPSENEDLARGIGESGVLVAELAPGAPPLPEHFPLRNRIISGISLATIIVEASERSGSLITARCALDQGRGVMAVPGNVLSGRNRGSHALLKDGACIVESAADVLLELGWPQEGSPRGGVAAESAGDAWLKRMDPGEAYDLDGLALLAGVGGPKLLARLTELELGGRIRRDGGRFVRVACTG